MVKSGHAQGKQVAVHILVQATPWAGGRGARTDEGGGARAEAGEGEEAVADLLDADEHVAVGVQEGLQHPVLCQRAVPRRQDHMLRSAKHPTIMQVCVKACAMVLGSLLNSLQSLATNHLADEVSSR